METIVAKMLEILNKDENKINKETQLLTVINKLMCECMAIALEQIDASLVKKAKNHGAKIDKKSNRTLSFLFGEVNFSRYRLYDANKKPFYPVDEFLGIEPRDRYSTGAQAMLSAVSIKGTYRNVASIVNTISPISISHQKLCEITRNIGEKIAENETKDLETEVDYESFERKVIPVLYLEGDAVKIKGNKNNPELYIHRYQICEGREKIGKNRNQLVGFQEFVGVNRKVELKKLIEFIKRTYKTDEIVLIINTDNGSGYGEGIFKELAVNFKRTEFFIDPYHINRKIKERLSFAPELQSLMIKAISTYKKKNVQTVLDTALSLATDADNQKAEENIELLRKYINRNWKKLKPYSMRDLSYERVTGTCESNHRAFTYRMKKQGKSWSKRGANSMCKVISTLRNNSFKQLIDHQGIDKKHLANDEFSQAIDQTRTTMRLDTDKPTPDKYQSYLNRGSLIGRQIKSAASAIYHSIQNGGYKITI